VRCSGPPTRLRSNARADARCPGLRPADAHDRGSDRCSAGRQACPEPVEGGYDADAIRQELADAEIEAVIPAKRNRRNPAPHDRVKYRWRNRIERLFSKLKNWRRIATRYDKTTDSYIGFVSLASALLWLPFVHVA